jgi:enediyne biosynthesis protein E4
LIGCYTIQAQPLFSALPSKETGITFQNKLVESPEANIITYEYFYNGGGAAAADFNNDGLVDLYFTSNQQENKLYLNKGGFKFQDITRTAGVGGRRGWKTGVSVADVNGDGFLDIYVCYSGDVDSAYRVNQLFINNGNLTFTDKAKAMGVADAGYTTHAVFFDMDRDGDLDLYVLNHNIKSLRNFDAAFVKKMVDPDAGDRLYENLNGKFIDISRSSGIISNPLGYGLSVNIADINNDGWPDIYVSNDYVEEDYLYINNRNGTFSETLKQQMGHLSNFSMGVDIADFNNDGWPDVYTLDMLPEDNRRQKLLYAPDNYELYNNVLQNGFHHQLMRNMLQVNNGNGTFSEVGQVSGISNTDWSWAALFADFNNDGQKDLFVTNGYGRDMINRDFMKFYANERLKHLQGKTDSRMFLMLQGIKSTPLHNYIFENKGGYAFADRSTEWGFAEENFSHGAVYADLDNDGDLDLAVNKMNQEAGIYRNNTIENKQGRNYIRISLRMDGDNKFAIGARATVFTASGKYMLENYPVHGFQSAMQGPLHIAFPDTSIDSVLIRWPDGRYEMRYDNNIVNSSITISRDKSKNYPYYPEGSTPLFVQRNEIIPFTHKEPVHNDFKIQPLMPNMISYNGPRMATADINNDGLDDVYICGTRQQAGTILLQQDDGSFINSNQLNINKEAAYEDCSAAFFDADKDGDMDLYVVSGGYASQVSELSLQDRLYINEKGTFTFKANGLPVENHSGSQVVPLDFDTDGDIDLFVAGRVVPGRYPEAPGSMLLVNDGKGNFTNETKKSAPDFLSVGMITDAKWIDLNNDKINELILCGEWMPIQSFSFENGRFINTTSRFFDQQPSGWWNTMTVADMDKDGDADLIAGNWGTNAQFKPTALEPMELYYADFDKNGFIDPLLCYYIQGKSYPMASRDELTDQIVSLRQRFPTYDSYANATIADIFPEADVKAAPKLSADYLPTTWFENVKGKLVLRSLPPEAGFSPVYAIVADDFNKDGNMDLLLAGNADQVRIKIGKTDANYGCLLAGDGKGGFTYINQMRSGLNIKGCVRSMVALKTKKDKKNILVGLNNLPAVLLTY